MLFAITVLESPSVGPSSSIVATSLSLAALGDLITVVWVNEYSVTRWVVRCILRNTASWNKQWKSKYFCKWKIAFNRVFELQQILGYCTAPAVQNCLLLKLFHATVKKFSQQDDCILRERGRDKTMKNVIRCMKYCKRSVIYPYLHRRPCQ